MAAATLSNAPGKGSPNRGGRASWPACRSCRCAEHDGISTALVRWAPDTQFHAHTHFGGDEILVLDGVFRDEFGTYPAGSCLRSPRLSRHAPFTGPERALIYVKVGHLGTP